MEEFNKDWKTPITELMTKELGFIDEALRLDDNLFFYKHPCGYVRLAYCADDITENIETLEQLQGLYFYLSGGKVLERKIFN